MSTQIFKLKPPQAQILRSKKRFKVVNAGRSFGKTWVSGAAIMDKALNNDNKTVIYIAPTLVMARNLMWDKWIKEHIPEEYIAHKNEQFMVMTFTNGSKFYCLSAEHPDRLRGLRADLLIVDECAMIDNGFYEVIRPVLSSNYHDGEALYISTPQGYNWFYKIFCKGKKNPDSWDCFEFTTLDGGNVSQEEIEEAKKDMSPKMFAQEYMASFNTISGRVYENFDRDLNTCELDENWGKADLHIGMDFNVNPMTAAIAVEENGNLYFFDEIVLKNTNTQETADTIKKRYPMATVYVYPDPTGNKRQSNAPVGLTDFEILKSAGFIVCAPPHPYATKDKFNTVNAALCDASGNRKVFIAEDRCLDLRESLEGYTYKDNGDTDKSSGYDHITDAAAYLICYKLPSYSSRAVYRPRVYGT
ncbi:MAG: terminase family protein [Methanobrevibacter sp.]|nr:terminase family protein [Methanobrevibacter sp.]